MFAYLLALSIICTPSPDIIQEAVETYINTNYSTEYGEYQFDFRRINWNLIPGEFDSVRVFKIAKESPLGNTVFTLGIFDNGKLFKAIPVSIGVTLLTDALVTSMPINVSEQVTDVRIEKRTITGRGEMPVIDSTRLEGLQAKNYIKAGSIVYMSMLEPIPVISPGDDVEIVYEKGALKVSARGVARQKGGVGDNIKVSNVESKKIIKAEIVDSLTVVLK